MSVINRCRPLLIAVTFIAILFAPAAMSTLGPCLHIYFIPPIDPPHGTGAYAILTTGRTTDSVFQTGSPTVPFMITHKRTGNGCASDAERDVTLGPTEWDCFDTTGNCPAVPYTCPDSARVPPTEDALQLVSCIPGTTGTTLQVGLRVYYMAPLPFPTSLYTGFAARNVYGHQSWRPVSLGAEVQCMNYTIEIPRMARRYTGQITLLRNGTVPMLPMRIPPAPSEPQDPTGTFRGGDTENWTLDVTYTASEGYRVALYNSAGPTAPESCGVYFLAPGDTGTEAGNTEGGGTNPTFPGGTTLPGGSTGGGTTSGGGSTTGGTTTTTGGGSGSFAGP